MIFADKPYFEPSPGTVKLREGSFRLYSSSRSSQEQENYSAVPIKAVELLFKFNRLN